MELNLINKEKPNYNSILLEYGLKDLTDWNCYELASNPGFYIIPNPFVPGHQRLLVKKCLSEYHDLPSKTNLDLQTKRIGNLWNQSLLKNSFADFNKLRWATVGYHYDWTNKVYNSDDFTAIPRDIEEICKFIAGSLFFENFKPEAGIINYYHLNSTLSAHQDRSEKNMSAPLLSISLGSQAIFLLGSESKATRPEAIRLQSGDICVMSGKSRLSYHGVPKILKDDNIEGYFKYSDLSKDFMESRFYVSDTEWEWLYEYIKINRINLNIRQVF